MVRLGMAAPSLLETRTPCSLQASLRLPMGPLTAALAQGHYFLDVQIFISNFLRVILRNMPNVYYSAAKTWNPDNQALTIIVTGLSTPIRAKEPDHIITFIMLYVLAVSICMAVLATRGPEVMRTGTTKRLVRIENGTPSDRAASLEEATSNNTVFCIAALLRDSAKARGEGRGARDPMMWKLCRRRGLS